MIALSHPVSGHQIKTDEASVDFWKAAGYREATEPKAPAKKAASRKAKK